MTEWAEMTASTQAALQNAVDTFAARGSIYRDNHQRAGATLAALFPQGVTINSQDDHERFALMMLLIVKLTRYAVEWGNGGHKDSIHDTMVYAAMLEARTK